MKSHPIYLYKATQTGSAHCARLIASRHAPPPKRWGPHGAVHRVPVSDPGLNSPITCVSARLNGPPRKGETLLTNSSSCLRARPRREGPGPTRAPPAVPNQPRIKSRGQPATPRAPPARSSSIPINLTAKASSLHQSSDPLTRSSLRPLRIRPPEGDSMRYPACSLRDHQEPNTDAGPLGGAGGVAHKGSPPLTHPNPHRPRPPVAPPRAATFPPPPRSAAGVPQGPRKPLFRAPCPRGAQLAGGLPPPPTYCGLTVHYAAEPFGSRRDPATAP